MPDLVFIGDRLTAAGFRLAGVTTYVPEKEEIAARVEAERPRCRVLAMTADALSALPTELANDLRAADAPLLAIVPDIADTQRPDDLEREVRRALGIEV